MSSKKKRAAIDLSLEAERSDEDHSSGGGGKGDRRWDKDDGAVDKKEEQFKEQGEAPKEETGEEKVVVEVVVDQGGDGTKEIKYRTQQGEEMEDDKQSAADAHGDGESDGGKTRAQDKHVVVEAAGNGDGDDNYSTMVQDEVSTYTSLQSYSQSAN
jgi:hypothetical protein